MSPELIAILAVGISSVAFLWSLHRDLRAMDARIGALADRIGTLAERVARLEGSVEILSKFLIDRERGREAAP